MINFLGGHGTIWPIRAESVVKHQPTQPSMGVNVSQMTRVKPSDYFRLHPTSMISKHSNNPDSWHSLYIPPG